MIKTYTIPLDRFIKPGDQLILSDHKDTPLEREVVKISFFEDHIVMDITTEPRWYNG